LYKLLTDDQILLGFGDKDQCSSIEKNDIDKNSYIIDDIPLFRTLCGGNRYLVPYIQGSGRFEDEKLLATVEKMRTTGILPPCEAWSDLLKKITKPGADWKSAPQPLFACGRKNFVLSDSLLLGFCKSPS
jgi:hypothetical protein